MVQVTHESEVQHMAKAPRTERLQTMVTVKERSMLERAAERRGWTVSEYLRASALVCFAVEGDSEALRGVGAALARTLAESMKRKPEELLAG